MRSHVPRLSVQLVLPVGQAEHPQLAVGELLPCCEYVGNKEGEASVVVEPPDVDGSASLLGALLELGDIPHDLLCKWPSLGLLWRISFALLWRISLGLLWRRVSLNLLAQKL